MILSAAHIRAFITGDKETKEFSVSSCLWEAREEDSLLELNRPAPASPQGQGNNGDVRSSREALLLWPLQKPELGEVA